MRLPTGSARRWDRPILSISKRHPKPFRRWLYMLARNKAHLAKLLKEPQYPGKMRSDRWRRSQEPAGHACHQSSQNPIHRKGVWPHCGDKQTSVNAAISINMRPKPCSAKAHPRRGLCWSASSPGDQEDIAGKPFVGSAGRLLDECQQEAGVDRSLCYVTSAVKHFSSTPRQMAPSRQAERR